MDPERAAVGWCTYRSAGFAEGDEIAAGVAFLASDDASFSAAYVTLGTFAVHDHPAAGERGITLGRISNRGVVAPA